MLMLASQTVSLVLNIFSWSESLLFKYRCCILMMVCVGQSCLQDAETHDRHSQSWSPVRSGVHVQPSTRRDKTCLNHSDDVCQFERWQGKTRWASQNSHWQLQFCERRAGSGSVLWAADLQEQLDNHVCDWWHNSNRINESSVSLTKIFLWH